MKQGSRLVPWLTPVCLVLAVAAVYWNSLGAPFLFDDGPAILRNESIRAWGTALRPPADGAGVTGRPVVNLTLAMNYAAGGLEPRGYHMVNMLLHALAVLALWGVVRRTLRRAAPDAAEGMAFAIALLWAVHPLLTESVVCVVQRNEILGGLFMLLTLYGLIRAAESERGGWLVGSVAACLLGVGSKEVVAVAPVLVLVYDRTFAAGSFREAWRRRRGYYVALAATWVPLGWLMAGSEQRAGTVGFGLGMSAWDYLLTQCKALTTYLKLSLWPHPLIVDYGMEVSRWGEVWWRGVIVLGLLGATVWALVRRPVWGFVGAWFFVILAPSSSFVPLTTQTIAEHRMYLPLVAMVVLVVAGLWRLFRARALCAVVAVALVWGVVTVRRNNVYQDEQRLWMELVAMQPENARAQASLAYFLVRQERWTEAEAHYREALRLAPGYADAHHDLAEALTRLGRAGEALEHLREAQRLKPEDVRINTSLGLALVRAGRPQEALGPLEAALRADARHARAQAARGDALFDLGRLGEAVEAYARAVELQPAYWEARHNLALTLGRLGRPAEAITQYEEVIKQRPESAVVRHNYALALAQLGEVGRAIEQEEAALRIDPGYEEARRQMERLRR
jgi:tetratricopeptide (TPR) repeat protein